MDEKNHVLKIAIATAAIVAAMVAVRDATVLEHAGLLSSCSPVAAQAADEGGWQACRPGSLDGRPDLSRKSCLSHGIVGDVEYWACPAGISTERDTE